MQVAPAQQPGRAQLELRIQRLGVMVVDEFQRLARQQGLETSEDRGFTLRQQLIC